ncbi:MAG: Mrp/NBP35 family ATP-binding protein [Pseudomonadota bacterium]
MATEQADGSVIAALRLRIKELFGDRVEGVSATGGDSFRLLLDVGGLEGAQAKSLVADVEREAASVAGVSKVSVVATAHGTGSASTGAGTTGAGTTGAAPSAPRTPGGHDNPIGLRKRKRIADAGETLPNIKNVIAVSSGKGGVGKSTVAANLALALSSLGHSVGLLDADIYGPSVPTLFGVSEKPPLEDDKIIPHEKFGLTLMSIGFLVDPDKALAWRGPMVMGALRQLMNDVAWGPLDTLVIDTPPGTGDAHLTLAQTKRLTGAIIVSTPQEMALADVRRGVELYRKTNVPVLGVIENMAWLEDASGARMHPFGQGGAARAAQDLDAPFLGYLPMFPALQAACDAGEPLVYAEPESEASKAFLALAQAISEKISAP